MSTHSVVCPCVTDGQVPDDDCVCGFDLCYATAHREVPSGDTAGSRVGVPEHTNEYEALIGLDEKLRVFDDHADRARDELVRLLTEDWEYVKAVARGRHAWGHFRYGDSLMFEYEPQQLVAETVEELADGVVYTARRLSL